MKGHKFFWAEQANETRNAGKHLSAVLVGTTTKDERCGWLSALTGVGCMLGHG